MVDHSMTWTGQRLKALRLKLNYTQDHFAQILLTARNTIQNWEKVGDKPLSDDTKSIARFVIPALENLVDENGLRDWLRYDYMEFLRLPIVSDVDDYQSQGIASEDIVNIAHNDSYSVGKQALDEYVRRLLAHGHNGIDAVAIFQYGTVRKGIVGVLEWPPTDASFGKSLRIDDDRIKQIVTSSAEEVLGRESAGIPSIRKAGQMQFALMALDGLKEYKGVKPIIAYFCFKPEYGANLYINAIDFNTHVSELYEKMTGHDHYIPDMELKQK